MKSFVKSLFVFILAAAMLFAFAACKGGNKQNAGNDRVNSDASVPPVKTAAPTLRPDVSAVTYTIDATAAYSSGMLSREIIANLDNNGMLTNKSIVTLPKDSNISSTFDIFDRIYGIKTKIENGRITSIQGVENGACGENSRWTLSINGTEITGSLDSIILNNNDAVVWTYVID